MNRMTRGMAAAFALGALALPSAAQAAPATVTVRVEGPNETLLPETKVTVDGSGVPGLGCPNTAAEALDKATNGNWQRVGFFNTVLGVTLTYSNADPVYWAQWHDGKYGNGACNDVVTDGGEVLILADKFDPTTFAPTVLPTYLTGVPAAGIVLGDSVTVRVEQVATDGSSGSGTKQPLAGATVTAGAASAVTDATGNATLTPSAEGTFSVRAVKGAQRTPARTLAVGPAARIAAAAATPTCRTTGTDGRCGSRDRQAPLASISGLTNGQLFAPGKGPRTLSGIVGVVAAPGDTAASGLQSDPSGLLMVKLRIARRDGGTCSYFSGTKERFVPAKCGAQNAKWFRIEAGATWSYLLPSALPRGRYVIDANAIDKAYNRDNDRVPGRNRMVITVG